MDFVTAIYADQGPDGRRGLIKINNKPMVEYVLDAVPDDTSKILLILNERSSEEYSDIVESYGAETAIGVGPELDIRYQLENVFRKINAEGVLTLSCDTPLINREVTTFLSNIITKFSAGIPRPVFDKPEFIPASYRVKPFIEVMDRYPGIPMTELVKHVGNVLYISGQSFKIFDEKLRFLVRVSSAAEARKVAHLLR